MFFKKKKNTEKGAMSKREGEVGVPLEASDSKKQKKGEEGAIPVEIVSNSPPQAASQETDLAASKGSVVVIDLLVCKSLPH
jgi:hypothetical protein